MLSESMQQIYRRTPIPKCDFNKIPLLYSLIEITLRYECSFVNLLNIFRTHFYKNTFGGLLLAIVLRYSFLLILFILHYSEKDHA